PTLIYLLTKGRMRSDEHFMLHTSACQRCHLKKKGDPAARAVRSPLADSCLPPRPFDVRIHVAGSATPPSQTFTPLLGHLHSDEHVLFVGWDKDERQETA
ncbi:MAG: hypothetical protein RLY47_180, partial [Candidatus Parcubacteria bacterium]